jgi:hypothetical protein
MDQRLKEALDFSNYRQTLAIQRKTLKEKIEGKLTYGCSGGIFKIDRSLLVFVQMLIDQGRTENVPLIERMRFLGIYSNNMDEFFRVRVANIKRIISIKKSKTDIFRYE